MPTSQQDKQFAQLVKSEVEIEVISTSLDNAVDWIKDNLQVQEVFDEVDIIAYVKENNTPSQVFSHEELVEWAEENYVKSED